MRKNFTCKFNGYVTPDNRDGIILSIISQFQGYNCDPEVTLTDDNGLIVSVTLDGDLTSSLIRDKLAFNYFIQGVTSSDSIRKVKKMVLPQMQASVGLKRLQDIRDGKFDNLYIDNPEGIYKNIESLVMSSWVKTADPTGDAIPEIFTGDDEGSKEIDVSERSQIQKDDTVDEPDDLGATKGIVELFTSGGGLVSHGSRLGAGGGDSGGPGLGLNPLPHERVDVRDSQGAAPEGVGISSGGDAAIPFNALISGGHDLDILSQGGSGPTNDAGHDSLGVPSGARPQLGLAAFKRISNDDDFERTTQMNMSSGGGLPALGLGEEGIAEPWSSVASKNNIYFGLAHEHPYDEDMDDYNDL